MLFGFALENLAKGIIVCRDPTLVTRKFLQNWDGKGHDLAALFDWAQISLADEERELLVRTSRTTIWKGRYPVPINFKIPAKREEFRQNLSAFLNAARSKPKRGSQQSFRREELRFAVATHSEPFPRAAGLGREDRAIGSMSSEHTQALAREKNHRVHGR